MYPKPRFLKLDFSFQGVFIPDILIFGFLFLFGAIVGSFLNVCIYRMPREQSIVTPRSRCPRCEKPIAWRDNIPVLSWILLRARCRNCRAPISWRYPLVELMAGGATIAVVARFGLNPVSVVYLAFVYSLIVISFIDFDFQIIPDEISVGGAALGMVLSILIPQLHGTDSRLAAWQASSLGVLIGGGSLYATAILGDWLFKKESMGGGDIKLLGMAGAILGWKAVAIAFLISPFFAVGPGLLLLAFKKEHAIPYGPFLSIGLLVALFADDWVLRISGIQETVRLLRDFR